MNSEKPWWQYSFVGTAWQGLQLWQRSSLLLSANGLGILLVILLLLLPYLSNNQIGLLLIVAAAFVLPQIRHKIPLQGPLLTYGAIAVLATLFSPVRSAAFDGLVKLVLYGFSFIAFVQVIRSDQRWRSVLVEGYLLTTLVVCVFGLRQQFFGAQQLATWWDPTSELSDLTRVYSFLGNPNLLAGYLLPAIPLATVAVLLTKRWSWRILWGTIGIASLLCIVYTYSRGAWLGLAVEIIALPLVLLYWRFPNLPVWALPGVLVGMITTIGVGILFKPSIRIRVASIFSVFAGSKGIDQSISFRLKVIDACLDIVKRYPLIGIGPGNKAFNQVYPLFQKVRHSALGAYSIPLEITIETGFVGLIAYAWLLIAAFRSAWHYIDTYKTHKQVLWTIGGAIGVAGLMVHALFDTVWYRPQVQVLWWLCVALMVYEGNNHKQEDLHIQ